LAIRSFIEVEIVLIAAVVAIAVAAIQTIRVSGPIVVATLFHQELMVLVWATITEGIAPNVTVVVVAIVLIVVPGATVAAGATVVALDNDEPQSPMRSTTDEEDPGKQKWSTFPTKESDHEPDYLSYSRERSAPEQRLFLHCNTP
jgi:hypothetical protein